MERMVSMHLYITIVEVRMVSMHLYITIVQVRINGTAPKATPRAATIELTEITF